MPTSVVNALRRAAVDDLEHKRLAAYTRVPRAAALEPPAPYPEDTLSYLANVYNHKARDFYARHGFECQGEVFEAAGLPHQTMVLNLAADTGAGHGH